MEKIRRTVAEIAYTPLHRHRNLPLLHRSLLPFLSLASSLYRFSLFLHQQLYHLGLLKKQRMPVPVISVGNLSWGGNGKTPMVEYIARFLVDAGISPLILTRGYAGGDEAKMLQRHFVRTSAKVGVGANRSAVAASFLERDGCINNFNSSYFKKLCPDQKLGALEVVA
ncbi:putative tetraacyldisaccharide 4'-kinase, mitochondrial isoform X1 [Cinnamomum micranthum f. kanehirae]|uniref:tetraacyldisaccharide 4'-kinase n=1 Tax=Cinnamomum micranthum f. kanehirae TaxID=337451 RepID=A0A3S3MFQ3_9MAGN|nr:putative tetraacyldisaccharide 4'-kinase, mitochondrial isoform X1 [Cinnamomum micranthum f. kanehirae]